MSIVFLERQLGWHVVNIFQFAVKLIIFLILFGNRFLRKNLLISFTHITNYTHLKT